MTVGSRIKDYRTQEGLTQTELADKVKISKQTLYKYENDIITNIPSDKIEAIASVLNVTPAALMGWNNSSPSTSDMEKTCLNRIYDSLNQEGKERLVSYARDHDASGNYKLNTADEDIG